MLHQALLEAASQLLALDHLMGVVDHHPRTHQRPSHQEGHKEEKDSKGKGKFTL
jgi:hypothetical protein